MNTLSDRSEENSSRPETVDLNSLVGTTFSSTEVAADNSLAEKNSIALNKAIGPEYDFRTLHIQLLKQQTDSFIRELRAKVSGLLAFSLWISLIATGWWHTHMIGIIATETLENSASVESGGELDFEAYDKSSAIVGDTAKTLYAVISPLATAITGFYFVIQTNKSDNEDENN